MSFMFDRYRPLRNAVALPVLLALVLSYLSVASVPVNGLSQDEPVSSMSAEGIVKLSWIALGFTGQTIRSYDFSNFSRTFLRAGAGSEVPAGGFRRPERSRTDASVRLNPMVPEQVFGLRIARLKAG